jgi:hypothetical protein
MNPFDASDVPSPPPYRIAAETWLIPNFAPAGDGLYLPVNSMVIRGREPVIVDTGAPVHRKAWLEKVFSVVEPEDVRWIFLSHDDGDHTGGLLDVLERAPQATLVTNFFSVERLALEKPALPLSRMRWIEPGGRLDVGDRVLQLFRPPIFDGPTTRGLHDPTTAAMWIVDTFACLTPGALEGRGACRRSSSPDVGDEQRVSPWHAWLDRGVYARHVHASRTLGAAPSPRRTGRCCAARSSIDALTGLRGLAARRSFRRRARSCSTACGDDAWSRPRGMDEEIVRSAGFGGWSDGDAGGESMGALHVGTRGASGRGTRESFREALATRFDRRSLRGSGKRYWRLAEPLYGPRRRRGIGRGRTTKVMPAAHGHRAPLRRAISLDHDPRLAGARREGRLRQPADRERDRAEARRRHASRAGTLDRAECSALRRRAMAGLRAHRGSPRRLCRPKATSMIVDNCWNGRAWCGPDEGGRAARGRGCQGTTNAQWQRSRPKATPEDPYATLAWLANLLALASATLKAGMVLITGSIVPTFSISRGGDHAFRGRGIG